MEARAAQQLPAQTGRFKTLIILVSCENFRDEFPDSTGSDPSRNRWSTLGIPYSCTSGERKRDIIVCVSAGPVPGCRRSRPSQHREVPRSTRRGTLPHPDPPGQACPPRRGAPEPSRPRLILRAKVSGGGPLTARCTSWTRVVPRTLDITKPERIVSVGRRAPVSSRSPKCARCGSRRYSC